MSVRAAEMSGGRVPVDDLSDARMLPGERRVLARRGWAGESRDFFSILLDRVS